MQIFTESWTINADDGGREDFFSSWIPPASELLVYYACRDLVTHQYCLATELYQASGAFEHLQDFETWTL